MSEYREAKAQAKAEKARVKAMRPWWKKKRFIIPGVVVVLAIIGAAAGGGGSKDKTSDTGSSPDATSGVNSNFSSNGEHKPADDVEVVSCAKTVIDTVDVALRVTNHTSKRSNYTMEISLEDTAGTKVGDGYASTNNVEPGQVANVSGVATLSGSPASFKCVLKDVERFAS